MSDDLLLTFNADSSTVKIGLFTLESGIARCVGKGTIDFRLRLLTFSLADGSTIPSMPLIVDAEADLRSALEEAFGLLAQHFDMKAVVTVGHRVVHGGDAYTGPVLIDDGTLDRIDALTSLAPLHQPRSMRLIRAIRHVHTTLPQTASFDTAFHRGQTELVRRFAIPRALHEKGIKRYGFHGLSYKFVIGEFSRKYPAFANRKVVAAHLGSGASLCALDGGISRDTSMGFSTLDGIPMATRCGALDPGTVLHLLGAGGRSLRDVEDLLYHQSGLLGVSGISADCRILLESDRPEAKEALDLFTFRIAGEVARLTATLGGLDAIVFTAGIGEHQPGIRDMICDRLEWLGVALDPAANADNAGAIGTCSSRVGVFVIPTDEEQVIADEALSILSGKG